MVSKMLTKTALMDGKQFGYKRSVRIWADYGIDYAFAARYNQTPYFSITGCISASGKDKGFMYGCIHEHIAKTWPKTLKPLIRWHLCDINGLPMHYVADGLYWLKMAVGLVDNRDNKDALQIFKNHALWGISAYDGDLQLADITQALSTTTNESLAAAIDTVGTKLLNARADDLKAAFLADMQNAGVL